MAVLASPKSILKYIGGYHILMSQQQFWRQLYLKVNVSMIAGDAMCLIEALIVGDYVRTAFGKQSYVLNYRWKRQQAEFGSNERGEFEKHTCQHIKPLI